ncbi:MAG: glycoside hydrolase family 65 protein, partial [Pseudarcicella sp.]|nr:glycoside hydrolase family 65 protein [Pseudarcicella sp.]
QELTKITNFNFEQESSSMQDIIEKMYLPESKEKGVFLQQDGFLDKELIPVKEMGEENRPINQKWSWDRILRSCYIKQADVLQGIYFFEDDFDIETIRRNYDFYEPLTVHESSLSPCVHAILAAKLGDNDRSYEFYQRSARLDLDDYNNDTEDGCHITSMAGTWLAVIKGFGGLRVKNGIINIQPFVPKEWTSFAFKIRFRENLFNIKTSKNEVMVENLEGPATNMIIKGNNYTINQNGFVKV